MTIRGGANFVNAFCVDCGRKTGFLTPEAAAGIIDSDTREVYRRIESGELHYIEVGGVTLMVCARSLGKGSAGMSA